MKIYYFGRRLHPAGPGHYYVPGPPVDGGHARISLKRPVDGGYAPIDKEQVEGHVRVTYEGEDITILSFWDRSGDTRMNSNSTFILIGEQLTFDQAMPKIREAFPQYIARAEARFKIEEAK